ncbi:hypothetical protein CFIO01_02123 [Colletotrichum fioriniae PJ7]|uniref:Uncharacterized protein n=1 Tax=Colletotrichum fioriniae PJ7 TaxID=1445577 RepID=A0A010R884_9PEZI|nr:hypothetical protein CFIO01_02123 [Colletotrichum fioriniae PJ7]
MTSFTLRDQRVQNLSSRAFRFCKARLVDQGLSPRPNDGYTAQVPQFGSLEHHGLHEATKEKLWKFEIDRLFAVAYEQDAGVILPKLETAGSRLFSSISKESPTELTELSNNILLCLYIFILDDEMALSEKLSISSNARRIQTTRDQLARSTGRILDLPGRDRDRHYTGDDLDRVRATEREKPVVPQPSPRKSNSSRDNEKVEHPRKRTTGLYDVSRLSAQRSDFVSSRIKQDECFHLVDQITATLARIVILSQDSVVWHIEVIACLSMLSAKIKVLIAEPPLVDGYLDNLDHSVEYNEFSNNLSDSEGEGFSKYGSDVGHYCQQYTEISRWLCSCLEHVLGSVGSARPLHMSASHLDLCALIYKTGTGADHVLVYQDRWGAISGSSERLHLHWATTSLKLAFEMAKSIRPRNQPVVVSDNESITMSAGLCDEDDERNRAPQNWTQNVEVRSIIDYVTLMIPLSLASPTLGSGFSASLKTVSALAEFIDGVKSPKHMTCVFKLRHAANLNHHDAAATCSLSDSPLALTLLDNASKALVSGHSSPLLDGSTDKAWAMIMRDSHRSDLEVKRKQWKFQKDSIIIRSPLYVGTAFGSAVLLVTGGFMCAFFIGERIPGVDPFNFTMFSWIVAGFGLLAAKIYRVSEWSWRDFLLMQVTCRSVREVATVSGLEDQEVLTILLSSDGANPMDTNGPFQGVFGRPPVPGGFSIDVTTDFGTFLNCGILPIKVQTLEGPALVLLRLVRGYVDMGNIKSQGKIEKAYVCFDIPEKDGNFPAPVSLAKVISWVKVFGIYNRDETKFC